VGFGGDYGFAPANYIDLVQGGAPPATVAAAVASPGLPPRRLAAPDSDDEQDPPTPDSPPHNPATALASIIQKKSEQQTATRSATSPPPNVAAAPRKRVQFTPEESDEEAPPPRLPNRPPSRSFSPEPQYASARSPSPDRLRSPPARSITFDQYDPPPRNNGPSTPLSGSGYHLYNIYEYLTQPGKNKKMPVTLGINIPRGMIMIAPEKARDGAQEEWSADKMEYYSQEGKHIFMELKQPSKSVDFHCGAKDTATEIMSALGELAGAAKGAGLREVLAAGSGHSNVQKKGVMLFDFMAQGDDEVTVGLGDDILVLDDSASDEWWKVRRLKNGKEGVVPANYVEITETVPVSTPASVARSGTNAGRSVVEQNRREEEEMARQASRRDRPKSDARSDQVGPGLPLPARGSSLLQTSSDHRRTSQRSSMRESSTRDSKSSSSKSSSSKSSSKPSKFARFSVQTFLIISRSREGAHMDRSLGLL
jgi:hypothetical protein